MKSNTPSVSRAFGLLSIAVLFWASISHAKSFTIPFSEQVFECVYRLVGSDGDVATGFFVDCPDPNSKARSVLISNRHVFDNIEGDTVNVYLRKLGADSTFEVFSYPVPIRKDGRDLFTVHPDSAVDLAAIAVPVPSGFTVRVASKALLADVGAFADMEVEPGSQVSYLGYPRGYSSGTGDFPILRSGTVASYPVDLKGMYLIDGVVYEGNSGGLVYIDPPLGFNSKSRLEKQAARVIGVLTTSIAQHRDDAAGQREFLNLGGVISTVRALELLEAMGCQ